MSEPKLSERLRDSAHALAGMMTAGELDGTAGDARYALRALSLELLAFSDDAHEMEEAARPPTQREREGIARLHPALVVIDGGRAA